MYLQDGLAHQKQRLSAGLACRSRDPRQQDLLDHFGVAPNEPSRIFPGLNVK